MGATLKTGFNSSLALRAAFAFDVVLLGAVNEGVTPDIVTFPGPIPAEFARGSDGLLGSVDGRIVAHWATGSLLLHLLKSVRAVKFTTLDVAASLDF